MQHDSGDTDEVAAEAQIDAESERWRRAKWDTESEELNRLRTLLQPVFPETYIDFDFTIFLLGFYIHMYFGNWVGVIDLATYTS